MGMFDWLGKAYGIGQENSELDAYSIPDFQEDKDYRELQDYLKKYGTNMLEGNIPDYYKAIGETGGTEFENYLGLLKGDVMDSALESAAASGRGGGAATQMAIQKTGELSTEARYNDYARALTGKQNLLTLGNGITESARSAGQTQQAQVNAYALDKSKLEIGLKQYLDNWGIYQDQLLGDSVSSLYGNTIATASGLPSTSNGQEKSGFDWGGILNSVVGGSPTTTTDKSSSTKKTASYGAFSSDNIGQLIQLAMSGAL